MAPGGASGRPGLASPQEQRAALWDRSGGWRQRRRWGTVTLAGRRAQPGLPCHPPRGISLPPAREGASPAARDRLGLSRAGHCGHVSPWEHEPGRHRKGELLLPTRPSAARIRAWIFRLSFPPLASWPRRGRHRTRSGLGWPSCGEEFHSPPRRLHPRGQQDFPEEGPCVILLPGWQLSAAASLLP